MNFYAPPLEDNNIGRFILRHKFSLALVITLINYIFKVYHIGYTGFWFDEGYSAYTSAQPVSYLISEGLERDINPPLYLIFLHYWMLIFGNTETGVRLLSVVASSLAGGMLFLLCARFFNWQTAVFASLMFFTSNELYYYSNEARTFSLVILSVICTYYFFLSLIEKPALWKAIVLALCNGAIFYFHFLSSLTLLGQLILFPFCVLKYHRPSSEAERKDFILRFPKKIFIYFLVSMLIYAVLLYPWLQRIMELGQNGVKNFWLQKPTSREFKDCIYDFFNSKALYKVYMISFLITLILIACVKKLRDPSFLKRMLLFGLVMGPLLIYVNYLAAGFTPIFLKRYVLFSLIGFILVYTYTYSVLRINFYIKLGLFILLAGFTLREVKYPRPASCEYDKLAVFIKRTQQNMPNVFITNDLQDLISYYYDKDIFKEPRYHEKHELLREKGIYTPFNMTWPETEDLSKYRWIYYTSTFHKVADPGNTIDTMLSHKFLRMAEINKFKDIRIVCYYNPYFMNPNIVVFMGKKYDKTTPEYLAAKEEYIKEVQRVEAIMRNDPKWIEAMEKKGRERNLPADSMLKLDAAWMAEREMMKKP